MTMVGVTYFIPPLIALAGLVAQPFFKDNITEKDILMWFAKPERIGWFIIIKVGRQGRRTHTHTYTHTHTHT